MVAVVLAAVLRAVLVALPRALGLRPLVAAQQLGPVLRPLGYNPAEAEIDKLMEEYDADGVAIFVII